MKVLDFGFYFPSIRLNYQYYHQYFIIKYEYCRMQLQLHFCDCSFTAKTDNDRNDSSKFQQIQLPILRRKRRKLDIQMAGRSNPRFEEVKLL